jgi:hypothetical protein
VNASRPDRPEWTAANRIGATGERAVADIFRKIGLAVQKMTDRCADLAVTGKIEVKKDCIAHRSGRAAVETSYRNRPSGINAGCADGWAFVLMTGEIILVNAARLRAAVANLPDVPAGEGSTVRLLPLAELRALGVSVGGVR